MAAEGRPPTSAGAGDPESLSYILRIGKALLIGFIRSLFEQHADDNPQGILEEQLHEDVTLMEDVPDLAQVTSLKECMLRLWQELRSNSEITCMVKMVTGNNPLKVLAEVSETVFADGINWGRIIVFFYFAYRVIAQFCANWFPIVLDWAMDFLRDSLATWIQQQGGWAAMLNCVISSRGRERPSSAVQSEALMSP